MIFLCAAENRKIRGICPCPAIREGDTRVGVLRVSGRTNRVYARPAAGFPRCRCFPNISIIALSAPKEKGFPSLLLCFAADGGKMLFSVKADAFGSAAKQFKPHGCAMRRGRGGDRKAPSSRPQTRNPLRNKKVQAAWECTAKGSRGRPQSPLVAPAGAKSPAQQKNAVDFYPKIK